MKPEPRVSETAPSGSLEGVARDASTIIEIVAAFEREGFGGQFLAREGARLVCATCRAEFDVSRSTVAALRRLEGASDPDDMLAVAALVCPECGARGTVVLGYGPASSAEDTAVLAALEPAPPPRPDGGVGGG